MLLDVTRLRDFYASRLGAVTSRLIAGAIRDLWPNLSGLSILGIGYAVPYLGSFLEPRGLLRPAERVVAVMPVRQGVHAWPARPLASGTGMRPVGNLVALAAEQALPLPDQSMDRVLLVHALETTEETQALLREAWRVLTPSGRLLVVVPARGGIWAFSERTPFGYGRPFSRGQLEDSLRQHLFSPLGRHGALFMPPFTSRAGLRALMASEGIGRRWWSSLGGVLLMEAGKQVYASSGGLPMRLAATRRPVAAAAAPDPALATDQTTRDLRTNRP